MRRLYYEDWDGVLKWRLVPATEPTAEIKRFYDTWDDGAPVGLIVIK